MTRINKDWFDLFASWGISMWDVEAFELMPAGERLEVGFYAGFLPVQYAILTPTQYATLRLLT